MNNSHLSSILVDLQDRLSDNDRQRFDIYLKNNVSQSIEAESILNGILKLIQSLLHQNKINEKDFHLLIDGFKQMQCFDAAHRLTGFFAFLLLSKFDSIWLMQNINIE